MPDRDQYKLGALAKHALRLAFPRGPRPTAIVNASFNIAFALPKAMLVNTLRNKSSRHLGKAASSYADVSRFIRLLYTAADRRRHLKTFPTHGLLPRVRHRYLTTASNGRSALQEFSQSLVFPKATYEFKDLENVAAPTEVVLHGYIGARRDLSKKFSFIQLISRDFDYNIQLKSAGDTSEESSLVHEKLKGCRPNSPVVIRGILEPRPDQSCKDALKRHLIKTREISISAFQSLNELPKTLVLNPNTNMGPDQRHLQLRQEKDLRDALRFRANVAQASRDWLQKEHGFFEIETPLLFKSTPEGAREFLVPTRKKGFGYALPQSPQQFKQILMGSGISRYFQIARCFRDEDLRADRQPEFTQLDLEMSFATGEDVMRCVEALIKTLWAVTLQSPLPEIFPRMTYAQTMAQYGSDKPDLRRELEINRVGHLIPADLVAKITHLCNPIVECLIIKCRKGGGDPKSTVEMVSAFMDSSEGAAFRDNPDGAPGIFVLDTKRPLSGLSAFGFEAAERILELYEPEDGDLLLVQARPDSPFTGGSTALGRLGLELHQLAVSCGLAVPPTGTRPLWVTDFPLFSPAGAGGGSELGQGSAAGLVSTHHPFTAPKTPTDVALLATEPARAVGDHYDLVLNGVELGGGSRRIHHAGAQAYVLREVLRMPEARVAEFAHLLAVLRDGCPPHAGFALGFDRLVAVMLGKESIRDVIAFPKSGRGEDPLVKSPGPMTEEALRIYHLKLAE